MRLASATKMGFYPLPMTMINPIVSAVARNRDRRMTLLDPCAGQGYAGALIAGRTNSEPYLNELHMDRAEFIREMVPAFCEHEGTHVVNGSYDRLVMNRASFDILYLNPPYEFNEAGEREEHEFLKKMRPFLRTDGLLIFVIPQHILKLNLVSSYILSWFDQVRVFRFDEANYEDYKQVVLYGIHRDKRITPNQFMIEGLRQVGAAEISAHPIFNKPIFSLPTDPPQPKLIFRGERLEKAEVERFLKQSSIVTKDVFNGSGYETPLKPIMPMKIGHIGGIVASGNINNKRILVEGEPKLVKGSTWLSNKSTISNESDEKKDVEVHETVTRHEALITSLDNDGNLVELKGDDLRNFLANNSKEITNRLSEDFKPRYNFTMEEFLQYYPYLAGINNREIPGTGGRKGLLPAQYHTVIGAATVLKDDKSIGIQGEMGSGKTIMGIGIAAIMHRRFLKNHFVVLCPTHLITNWEEELDAVWPEAAHMRLNNTQDIDQFFNSEGPIFGLLKSTKAAQGSGWTHNMNFFGPLVAKFTNSTKSLEIQESANLLSTVKEGHKLYGRLSRQVMRRGLRCPVCNGPVLRDVRKTQVLVQVSDLSSKQYKCYECSTPLYQDGGFGNVPVANLSRYILKRWKRHIGLLIADEAHEYRGPDSDRGYAFHRLASSSHKVLAMTGTTYQGKPKDVFPLMYRFCDDFRRAFTDPSKTGHRRIMNTEFSKLYSSFRTIVKLSEDIGNSQRAGSTKKSTRVDELPGVAPKMLPWFINRWIFVSLSDMGMALPKYSEQEIEVDMDEEMVEIYDYMEGQITSHLFNGFGLNRAMLSQFISSLLYWPDAPWRPRRIATKSTDQTIFEHAGTGRNIGEHPKEKAILELIKDELAEGRNCLLLLTQTASLDIQPDWKGLLADHGIKASILRASPDKRKEWIDSAKKRGIQVIISHPKKVATGLNILDYPTIIFAGQSYEVDKIQQASSRAYRIGQEKECKVFHAVYTHPGKLSMQYRALWIIKQRMIASILLNGDTVDDGSIAGSTESTSVIDHLAKALMVEKSDEVNLARLETEYKLALEGFASDTHFFRDVADIDQRYNDLKLTFNSEVETSKTLSQLFKEAQDLSIAYQESFGGSIQSDLVAEIEKLEQEQPEEVVFEISYEFDGAPLEVEELPMETLAATEPIKFKTYDELRKELNEAPKVVRSRKRRQSDEGAKQLRLF